MPGPKASAPPRFCKAWAKARSPRPAPVSADLAAAGAKRISLGSGLARAALGLVMRAASEMAEEGTFGWLEGTPTFATLDGFMDGPD